jgi:crotonobetainyl-CoA:carnitine CoA-transferase CaiB-like acyl-CoA transferase
MKFVRNLLGALGRPELAPLCERPGPHQQPVMHFLEGVFRAKSLAENLEFLSKLDVCYAPVHTLPEALDAAADKLLRDEHGRRHLAPAIRFRHEPARPNLREPKLGEHDALKKGGST